MIRLIVSDFDGVLMDLREAHYAALNRALIAVDPKYAISKEQHNERFDGLPTSTKLEMLAEERELPRDRFEAIRNEKQRSTEELIETVTINMTLRHTVSSLRPRYRFVVASNAVRRTVELGLRRLGIAGYVDDILSNQDVGSPKPNPEIYLEAMARYGVAPDETLIIEDSWYGREAARRSGAHVLGIESSRDFTLEAVQNAITRAEARPYRKVWAGCADLTVLIPMAGGGSRFAAAGYAPPKPLVDVEGVPMIQRVVESLALDAHYVFLVQKQHAEQYCLVPFLKLLAPGCDVVEVDGVTEGAACTTLLAESLVNNAQHLVIANSDQIVEWDSSAFIYGAVTKGLDGRIATFDAEDPKWSYAQTDAEGCVMLVAEKRPISRNATCGIYYYRRGSEYVRFAKQMIRENVRVNGEFYVCPVYNEAVLAGHQIGIYPVTRMWGLGTPEDLQVYLKRSP